MSEYLKSLQSGYTFSPYSYLDSSWTFDIHSIPTSLSILVQNLINQGINYLNSASLLQMLKDGLFIITLFKFITTLLNDIIGYGIIGYIRILLHLVSKFVMQLILNSFFLKGKVDKEVAITVHKLEESLIVPTPTVPNFDVIPEKGLTDTEILNNLQELADLKHSEWEKGKVSGAVYHGGDELIKLQSNAFKIFCVANQLHPDVFPGVRKMEAEIVSIVLNLFNAPIDTGCGSTTSGGTESLLLACLSAKIYGYRYKGIREPEMVVPETAHAGFDKAAYYFGIKLHHARLDSNTYKVDLKHVKKLINSNTVLIAGSAPNFPHGIIDDIEGLSKLALKYKIPLHVDCCLGSFIVSYMKKAGFNDIPLFDFRLTGVTSISCDTHKYGFAPKGSSVIMYRNKKLRECQYYVNSEWTGGLYGSPTFAGSRPGALSVGCWSTLLKIGDDGYIQSCKEIVGAARLLKERIMKEIPELEIIGDPLTSVIAFKSSKINIYELSDLLSKQGWHLSALQKPAALHLAVTKLSTSSIDELIDILKQIIVDLSTKGKVIKSDTAALYGVAGSVQTTGVADRLITAFLNTLYKTSTDP
ncbi:hypothetical protein WICMUC_003621 [Wickerhamomyces mucosus]|uniref:sphinganine-1-phosphate aldolase n=1 Tax=Wickerhamomyces mucosus TaxID=1378264 RepID=A0A9P8PL38_9ASCO|nr:hypothetical protein WICMUC_003621 [Wickerhamomyces mucosus]